VARLLWAWGGVCRSFGGGGLGLVLVVGSDVARRVGGDVVVRDDKRTLAWPVWAFTRGTAGAVTTGGAGWWWWMEGK